MIRCPSVKRLVAEFAGRNLTISDAKLIRKLAKAQDYRFELREIIEADCESTARYAHSCYTDPYDSKTWRTTLILHAINEILNMFGVEPLGRLKDDLGPMYEYCNSGDTYSTTLIYSRLTNTIRIDCWGDLAERYDKKHTW